MTHIERAIVESFDASDTSRGVTRSNAQIERDVQALATVSETSSIVPRSPIAPNAPIIAGKLLSGPQISFIEFLLDENCRSYCGDLFGGEATSAATMLAEFRQGIAFDFFGPCNARGRRNAGRLDKPNSATKKMLKAFARLAYRGDRERRGVAFWERIATLIWHAYAHLMAMREQAETIRKQEIERLGRLPQKRAANAARARRYRSKQRVAHSSMTSSDRHRHDSDGAAVIEPVAEDVTSPERVSP